MDSFRDTPSNGQRSAFCCSDTKCGLCLLRRQTMSGKTAFSASGSTASKDMCMYPTILKSAVVDFVQ
eukprot:m.532674 g.532674  ORF g.532674 m.532674 type:complete len:67 (-) comp57596_c0_seq16:2862-3062(-)